MRKEYLVAGAAIGGAYILYTLYNKRFKQPPSTITIHVSEDKQGTGAAAAGFVAKAVEDVIAAKGKAKVIFATGASQFEFIEELLKHKVRWQNVTAFHLDEYVGLPTTHGASFRKYLKERLFDKMSPPPAEVHYLDPDKIDEYSAALAKGGFADVACIGIGENGHLAFNDPPPGGADFNDPKLVKKVELDLACRKQQLGEGWFPTLADVPTHAITLTIPTIMHSKCISCVVPDSRKAVAVKNTMTEPISEAVPSTLLRTHPNCHLWLDKNAAFLLNNNK